MFLEGPFREPVCARRDLSEKIRFVLTNVKRYDRIRIESSEE